MSREMGSEKGSEKGSENILKILSHLPLFQALTPEQMHQVVQGTREVRINKGDILFHKGDPSLGIYVVVFGQFKLAITSPQGSEKVVEIIGPRQSFGEAVMFLDRPYPVTSEALADSLLLHVARESLYGLLDTDSTFARSMIAGLASRVHALIRDVESYSMRSSMQRVIGYLLQHCGDIENLDAEVALPASKLVIASRLNLSPETLSRILHDLVHANLIEVHGRTINIPNPRRLRDYEV